MIITIFIATLRFLSVDIAEVRSLFASADKSETACERLFQLTDGYTIDYKPVVYAYHAAAEMTMANHVSWPGTKLSYFRSGKEKLEAVVRKYYRNIEIRYIRFAVQYGSPSFLGYRDNLDEDRNYVLANLENAALPQAQKDLMKATVSQK